MARATLTLANMAGMDTTFITAEEAAAVLECEPHNIRLMAASEEGRAALGFKVIRIGTVTKIPRAPFLRFMGWEGPILGANEEASA